MQRCCVQSRCGAARLACDSTMGVTTQTKHSRYRSEPSDDSQAACQILATMNCEPSRATATSIRSSGSAGPARVEAEFERLRDYRLTFCSAAAVTARASPYRRQPNPLFSSRFSSSKKNGACSVPPAIRRWRDRALCCRLNWGSRVAKVARVAHKSRRRTCSWTVGRLESVWRRFSADSSSSSDRVAQ